MSTALHWAALAAYLLGSAAYLGFVIRQKRGLHRMGRLVLWAGFGLHTAALLWAWMESGVFPAAGLRQALDVFSWGLMAATLIINLRVDVMILGALAGPLCSLLLITASVFPQAAGQPSPLLKSLWVAGHVLAMLLGYGLLALTFLAAVLYLVQDRMIRAKKLGPVFRRLPDLGKLDQLTHNALLSGFAFMGAGLIAGAVYGQIVRGSYLIWDPKEVWSLITWFMYAALLHSRLVGGWRGRRGAWLATASFAVLMFTFVGVGLWFPGYHSFENITRMEKVLP